MNTETFILKKEVATNRQAAAVFEYFADFSNVVEWDPSVLRSEPEQISPPAPGDTYNLKLRFGPRVLAMRYELRSFDAPNTLTFVGTGPGVEATDVIKFSSDEQGGCKISYEAEITLQTRVPRAVLGPLLTRLAERTGRQMTRVLNEQPKAKRLQRLLEDRALIPGVARFSRLGYLSSRSRNMRPLPDQAGRTIIVTGATSGLGWATCVRLAKLGANLVLVSRNSRKLEDRIQDLQAGGFRGEHRWIAADLSTIAGIDHALAQLREQVERVDALVNCAGALYDSFMLAENGWERTAVIHLLAPYRLATGLHTQLAAAPDGRVVNVSSGGMYPAKLNINELMAGPKPFDGVKAYAMAKRAQVVMSQELAKQWRDTAVHAMHPGWADTPGVQNALPGFYRLTKSILRNATEGADTIVWLAARDLVGEASGQFWLDREAHTAYAIPGTREPKEERDRLMKLLHSQDHNLANSDNT